MLINVEFIIDGPVRDLICKLLIKEWVLEAVTYCTFSSFDLFRGVIFGGASRVVLIRCGLYSYVLLSQNCILLSVIIARCI